MAAAATPTRGFWLLACGLLALLLLACLHVASLEWFSRDDFAFLVRVQDAGWSWREVFLPLDTRAWPFYRPLGMETYFFVCQRLFGLNAFGFFAVSLAFHFGSAWLVLRIARQLGFDLRVAVVCALIAVSRYPTLAEIFYGSVFHYVISGFLTLVTLSAFLERLQGGGRAWLATSWGAFGLSLLCNEVNVLTPVVLLLMGGLLPRARHGAGAVAGAALPHVVLAFAYLGFRFFWMAPVALRAIHTPSLGAQVWGNTGRQLLALAGGPRAALATGLVLGALLGWLLARGRGRTALARLGSPALGLLAWLGIALAPFVLLPFPQPRYSMLAQAPAALLVGVLLEALWRVEGAARPRALEAGMLLAVLASVPWAVLAERAAEPRGAQPLRLVQAVEAQRPRLAQGARMVVLYGGTRLADSGDAMRFRYLAYNGTVVSAVYPESAMTLRFHDVAERPGRNVIRPGTLYFELTPALEVVPASPAWLPRWLPRAAGPPAP